MKKNNFGKLPPRYLFALNPHADYRASSCPHCNKATYPRKFALLIHIAPDDLIALGKTCKYCPRCEMVIAHRNELEAELAQHFQHFSSSKSRDNYLVLGTVDLKAWRKGLTEPKPIDDMLAYVADFKGYREIEYFSGGRYPADFVSSIPERRKRAKPGKAQKS